VNPGLSEVLFFHTVAIQKYGGSEGVRDKGALEAAIARPWQAFEGKDAYATPFEKAAAICEAIIRRHPFVDGNKRTGISAGAYLLSTFGFELEVTPSELEDLAVAVAVDDVNFEALVAWFGAHSREA
jgi:death-on-curing protein